MSKLYDLIIIGGGPAGLTAGLYSGRSNLKTLILESSIFGGRITQTSWVDNYPGFPEGIGGYELGEKMWEQAKRFEVESELQKIDYLEKKEDIFLLKSSDKKVFKAKSVIIATGAEARTLGLLGEKEYTGRGISYCATCDAPFYKGAKVVVVGGGDSALTEALYLTDFASEVNLIHRRDEFRAAAILVDKVRKHPKIKLHLSTVVTEFLGAQNQLTAVKLNNLKKNAFYELKIEGVFLMLGYQPQGLKFLNDFVDFDEQGFIITDSNLHTKTSGLFVAGDVCSGNFRQVITAASDGALAAVKVNDFLSN